MQDSFIPRGITPATLEEVKNSIIPKVVAWNDANNQSHDHRATSIVWSSLHVLVLCGKSKELALFLRDKFIPVRELHRQVRQPRNDALHKLNAWLAQEPNAYGGGSKPPLWSHVSDQKNKKTVDALEMAIMTGNGEVSELLFRFAYQDEIFSTQLVHPRHRQSKLGQFTDKYFRLALEQEMMGLICFILGDQHTIAGLLGRAVDGEVAIIDHVRKAVLLVHAKKPDLTETVKNELYRWWYQQGVKHDAARPNNAEFAQTEVRWINLAMPCQVQDARNHMYRWAHQAMHHKITENQLRQVLVPVQNQGEYAADFKWLGEPFRLVDGSVRTLLHFAVQYYPQYLSVVSAAMTDEQILVVCTSRRPEIGRDLQCNALQLAILLDTTTNWLQDVYSNRSGLLSRTEPTGHNVFTTALLNTTPREASASLNMVATRFPGFLTKSVTVGNKRVTPLYLTVTAYPDAGINPLATWLLKKLSEKNLSVKAAVLPVALQKIQAITNLEEAQQRDRLPAAQQFLALLLDCKNHVAKSNVRNMLALQPTPWLSFMQSYLEDKSNKFAQVAFVPDLILTAYSQLSVPPPFFFAQVTEDTKQNILHLFAQTPGAVACLQRALRIIMVEGREIPESAGVLDAMDATGHTPLLVALQAWAGDLIKHPLLAVSFLDPGVPYTGPTQEPEGVRARNNIFLHSPRNVNLSGRKDGRNALSIVVNMAQQLQQPGVHFDEKKKANCVSLMTTLLDLGSSIQVGMTKERFSREKTSSVWNTEWVRSAMAATVVASLTAKDKNFSTLWRLFEHLVVYTG